MTDVISATQNRLIWASINWRQVEQQVRKIQVRIVKAVKKGKNTPGVDGQTWSTPTERAMAIESIYWKGYRPQPLKRV